MFFKPAQNLDDANKRLREVEEKNLRLEQENDEYRREEYRRQETRTPLEILADEQP